MAAFHGLSLLARHRWLASHKLEIPTHAQQHSILLDTRCRNAARATPARDLVPSISTSMALPKKIRFHHWASMGNAAMRARNFDPTRDGERPSGSHAGCLVSVSWLSAARALSTSRCRVGTESRPFGIETERRSTLKHQNSTPLEHFSPLNCTFSHCIRKQHIFSHRVRGKKFQSNQ